MPPVLVRAGWLVADPTHVVRDGAVLVGNDGRVAWSGTARDAPSGDFPIREEPGAVVVPGFVNTHAHLELTHLGGLVDEPAFPAWLQKVRALKEATMDDEFAAAARIGVAEMLAQGVTTIADTGSTGAAVGALAELGARGIAYHEVFGPHPSQAGEALDELATALDRLAPLSSDRVQLGVSPHAPYTVSDALATGAAEMAARRGMPIAMHIAESRDETAFVRFGSGPFATAHTSRQIPVAPRARSPVAWLASLGVLRAGWLCVHGVEMDEADVELLVKAGASVAHCPLSNAAHGHGRAPLRLWERHGVAVGLGTDSAASRSPLDLRADARATGATVARQLDLLTTSGARALGLRDVGTLLPGGWGDLVLVSADEGVDPLVAALSGPVLLTLVGGRAVYDAGQASTVHAAWTERVEEARRRLAAIGAEPAGSR